MWRFALVILALSVASNARADVKDYCEAYARDFADLVKKEDPDWQVRFDNAEAMCTERFSTEVVVEPKAKPKPKVQKAASKKPPKVAPAPIDEPAPETKAIKPVGKLEPGSPEWTAYCEKKYVSFNASKGTYLSKSGVERKCLVTADAAPVSAKAKAPKKPPAKVPAKR
jgi:BA14K-like protein